jgi:hypothetical protein
MKLVTEGKGTPGRGHGDHQGRGRDRGNAFGGGQRGGGNPGGGHEQGRMALVPEKEQLRPLEKAARATKDERAMALEDGWDPVMRQQGYLTQRADEFERVSGHCFTFDAHGRCPFGDTISSTNPKGCKFVHMSKAGKVVSAGVQTTVPAGLVCSHCGAVGQHWSFHCERKPNGGARGGGGGGRGGRGGGNGGRGKDNGGRGRGAGGGDSRGNGRDKGRGGARQRANFCRTGDGSPSNAPKPGEAVSARRAIMETKEMKKSYADSGCSSSNICVDSRDFVHLHYSKVPYVIDTAANGATMSTNFWGTTRTWAGGDNDKWVMLVQDGVLYVPEATEDLMSLSKVTQLSFKAIIHAGILELKTLTRVAPARWPSPSLQSTMSSLSCFAPRTGRTKRRSKSTAFCVRMARPRTNKACIAFPLVVTAKHDGEEDFKSGQGQGYINHCKLGHRSGAAGRVGLADIQPGTCACMFTGMVDFKEIDNGRRTAEFPLQIVVVDAQGPYIASIRGHRYWVCVVDVCTIRSTR